MDAAKVNDWENPQVVGRNKEPAHATLIPYPDTETALAGDRVDRFDEATSPFFKLLNGDWRFHWSPNPAAAPEGFHAEDFDAGSWDTIAVPGEWQMAGYGVPRYAGINRIFNVEHLPRVPEDDNETCSYRMTFTVPETWRDRQVFIVFDGVGSAFYL